MEEVARKVIIDQQEKRLDGIPWVNLEQFTVLTFKRIRQELIANKESLFCDRSMVDCIAYLKDAQKEVPDYLIQFPFEEHYQKTVFFAPPWSAIYEKDEQRPQEFEEHLSLSKRLRETYLASGFEIVDVPLTTVEKRVEFVLDKMIKFI